MIAESFKGIEFNKSDKNKPIKNITRSQQKSQKPDQKLQAELSQSTDMFLDVRKTRHSIREINQELNKQKNNYKLSYNSESNRLQVNIIDKDTGEIIRQLPSKEFIDLAQKVKKEIMHNGSSEIMGLLLDEK